MLGKLPSHLRPRMHERVCRSQIHTLLPLVSTCPFKVLLQVWILSAVESVLTLLPAVPQRRDDNHPPANILPVAIARSELSRTGGSSAADGLAQPAETSPCTRKTPIRPAGSISRVSSWSSLRPSTPSLLQPEHPPSPLARHASYGSLRRPVPRAVSQPGFAFGGVGIASSSFSPDPAPSAPTGGQSAQTAYYTHCEIEARGQTPMRNHDPHPFLADNASFGDHLTERASSSPTPMLEPAPAPSALGFDPGRLYPARASMRGVPVAPSPSPTPPPPVATPVLHPNDDPKSSTYGDGEGPLLMPRQTIRTKPDTKGMSKAERKQVNNSMRAKGEDFGRTENRILNEASSRLYALIPSQDPLPTAESEEAMAEECWDYARQLLGKRITHNRDLLNVVGDIFECHQRIES